MDTKRVVAPKVKLFFKINYISLKEFSDFFKQINQTFDIRIIENEDTYWVNNANPPLIQYSLRERLVACINRYYKVSSDISFENSVEFSAFIYVCLHPESKEVLNLNDFFYDNVLPIFLEAFPNISIKYPLYVKDENFILKNEGERNVSELIGNIHDWIYY